jgi:hypothetical protein
MAFLDFFTGVDSEETQRQMDDTDAKLEELNRKKLEQGKWDQATYDEAQRNLARGHVNVEQEVNAAFKEGLDEGVENVKGSIGSILAFPFRLIPPIGWVLILGAAFFYFGGGILLRRKITKA